MDTKICTATEHGTNGIYQVGIEYTVDGDGVHHAVRRPIPAGSYGSRPGDMSEWRSSGWGDHTKLRAVPKPLHPPYLNLPDEEHGHTWGDPIDLVEPIAPGTITRAQLLRAHSLARAHGHQWASGPGLANTVALWRLEPIERALLADTADEAEIAWGQATMDITAATPALTRLMAAIGSDWRVGPDGSDIDTADIAVVSECLGDPDWTGESAPHVDDHGIVRHTTGTGRLRWAIRPDGQTEIEVSRPGAGRAGVTVLRALVYPVGDGPSGYRYDGPDYEVAREHPEVPLHYRHLDTMVRALRALGITWEPEVDIVVPGLRTAADAKMQYPPGFGPDDLVPSSEPTLSRME